MRPTPHVSNDRGSAAVILLVLIGAGVIGLVVNSGYQRISNQIDKNIMESAVTDAQNANVAALSYLQSALEAGPSSPALLKVVGTELSGTGNAYISVQNGVGFFFRPDYSNADEYKIEELFKYNKWTFNTSTAQKTQLKIIESKAIPGHKRQLIVRATSSAQHGSRAFFPVQSVGKIIIAEVPSDGDNVITDCQSCVDFAIDLTKAHPELGYIANPSITRNFGFYKIQASLNLCDIHFLKNKNDKIEDHSGKTTVLKTQIAVYCPCNCTWWKK